VLSHAQGRQELILSVERTIAQQWSIVLWWNGLVERGSGPMLNKLHILEQQAAHAQCVALLVEFVTAVRGQKVCLKWGGSMPIAIRPAVPFAVLTFLLGVPRKNPPLSVRLPNVSQLLNQ